MSATPMSGPTDDALKAAQAMITTGVAGRPRVGEARSEQARRMAEIIDRIAVAPAVEKLRGDLAEAEQDAAQAKRFMDYEKARADRLAAALKKCKRVNALRDEMSECYARINGAGRTTSVESTVTSKKRVTEIRAEIKAAIEAARSALAEGGK